MKISYCKFIISFLCIFAFAYTKPLYAQSGYVGESIYLQAPSVPGTMGNAAWTCDRNNDVYVSGNGYGATAVINQYFSGTATITCTYVYSYYIGTKRYYSESMHAYYYISCKASTVTLNYKEVTLKPGQEVELTYSNSSGITLPYVLWQTSDLKVANIDGYEKISGEKTVTICANNVGECLITCYANTGNTNPTCKVIVKADPPTAISVHPKQLVLQEGKKGKFTYQLTPEDAYTKVSWESSNESVATVSSTGLVSAVGQGTAQITATTSNGLSAYGTVEVTPLPQQVSLTNNQQTTIGYLFKLVPTLTPTNATTTYKWETADAKIATVDNMGRVKGKTAGTTTITVTTENGKTATCRVIVNTPSEGMDYRNVEVRLKTIKNLINKSLSNLKK